MLSLSEQAAFSFRAGYFLFSSSLYSLSNITKSLKKRLKNKQSPQPSYKQKPTAFNKTKPTTFLQASPQPSHKQSPQPSYKQSPQPSYKQSPQPSYKQKPTATPHPYCSKKHSENKQIQQNIPNILPFNIFLKSVLKKNRLSRLFDLEISIFYCNFATNLLTH